MRARVGSTIEGDRVIALLPKQVPALCASNVEPAKEIRVVTSADCRRWLEQQLTALVTRYQEKLDRVARCERASAIAAEVASIYRDVGAGRLDRSLQPSLIDRAFFRRDVMVSPDQLRAADAHPAMVREDGGPTRFAMRVVAAATGVSIHSMIDFRARSRPGRT